MDYLTKQADIYNLNIRVILGRFSRVSHYEVTNKKGVVLAIIYDINQAYWMQRNDNFLISLNTKQDVLLIK